MEEETSFDVVISGTSLVNAMVAGALARAGKRVLHVDPNDFYGENDATHDLNTFLSLSTPSSSSSSSYASSWRLSHSELLHTTAAQHSRRFALDLSPKLLLSAGPLVQLLLRSGVAHYLEFKCLQAAFLHPSMTSDAARTQADAIRVPCSKADVFQSTSISLVEKRFLMKFLGLFQQPIPEEWKEKSMAEFLKENKLEGLLESVIVHAICGADSVNSLTAASGAALITQYVSSVGRFGQTPFLFPLYGCSEATQAFCRLAAVKGALYMLRRGIAKINVEENVCKSVLDSEGKTWECNYLVLSPESVGWSGLKDAEAAPIVYRACVSLKSSIYGEGSTLAEATYVVGDGHIVHSIHLDSSMKVCPEGSFLVYLWSHADVIRKVLDVWSDEVEWVIEYTTCQRRGGAKEEKNIFSTSDPDSTGMDYDLCIAEAKHIFHSICGPDAEFFPAKPLENEEEASE